MKEVKTFKGIFCKKIETSSNLIRFDREVSNIKGPFSQKIIPFTQHTSHTYKFSRKRYIFKGRVWGQTLYNCLSYSENLKILLKKLENNM